MKICGIRIYIFIKVPTLNRKNDIIMLLFVEHGEEEWIR